MRTEIIDMFKEVVKSITSEDIVAVMHDTDPDGITSGVLVAKAIEKLRGKPIDLRISQEGGEKQMTKKTKEFLVNKGVTVVFTTDMAVDQIPEYLLELSEQAKIVVIDHHKIYQDLNEQGIVMIKAEYLNEDIVPAKYPTAKLTYDLFSQVCDLSEYDWIACIGIISDMAFDQWKDFVDAVFERYTIEKKDQIFDTDLARVGNMMSKVECYDMKKVKDCFDVLHSASSFREVLASPLQEYAGIIERELSKWRRIFLEKMKEDKQELVVFQVQSPYVIKSNLITHFGVQFPHRTLLFYQLKDGLAFISARRGDVQVKVNDLLEKSTKGLPGARAGGHPVAAGATIMEKDIGGFLQRLQVYHQE